jgi:ATP synthase protein I
MPEHVNDGRPGDRRPGERDPRDRTSPDRSLERLPGGDGGGAARTEEEAFSARVADLGDRLRAVARQRRAAARGAAANPDGTPAEADQDAAAARRGMAYGMRMAGELVAAVAVGGGIGVGLDRWLGTRPWLFLLFFLLGFAAGVLNVLRAYARIARQIAAAHRDGEGRANAHQ